MIVITCAQRSDEWKAARVGRLTGSVAGAMLSAVKSGESAGRRNLRARLVLERLTGKPQESGFVSPAMLAGIEREPLARAAYEAMTGDLVLECGFVQHDELLAGCSVDGYVGSLSEHLISIKCREITGHLDFVMSGTVPGDALAQMMHEMWITGAARHDYVSFHPDFPERLRLRMVTVRRQDVDLVAYEKKARAFLAEVDAMVTALETMGDVQAVAAAVVGE